MAHKHSVYDTDQHFVIDPITRKITNQSSKVKLMQFDHNSERLTFEIPRLVDGHDMSLCTKIEVHYINTSVDKKTINKDVYPVDDMQISPDSDDVVNFSWLVSRNATQLVGLINFIVRFSCLDGTTSDYVWNTDVCDEMSVSNSIDNGEEVVVNNSDVIEAWLSSIGVKCGTGDFSIVQKTGEDDPDTDNQDESLPNTSEGRGSVTLGFGNTNKGAHTVVFGQGCEAGENADSALCGGKECKVENNYDVALGRSCEATGYYSTSIGYKNKVHSDSGYSMGGNNTVDDDATAGGAFGSYNEVKAVFGNALGRENKIGPEARSSTAAGEGLESNHPHQLVAGKFNNNKSTTMFEVGNGASKNSRGNAFEVHKDGHTEAGRSTTDDDGDKTLITKDYFTQKLTDEADTYNGVYYGKIDNKFDKGDKTLELEDYFHLGGTYRVEVHFDAISYISRYFKVYLKGESGEPIEPALVYMEHDGSVGLNEHYDDLTDIDKHQPKIEVKVPENEYGIVVKTNATRVDFGQSTVKSEIAKSQKAVVESKNMILDPANICTTGTYKIKVVFAEESAKNALEISQRAASGHRTAYKFLERGSFNPDGVEILPKECVFEFSIAPGDVVPYGVAVYGHNMTSYEIYSTYDEEIHRLHAKKVNVSDLHEHICEYERTIPYVAKGDPQYQKPPTAIAVERTYNNYLYDIISVDISGYVNLEDGRGFYFNHDITRQVQGVPEGEIRASKLAGVGSALGDDSLIAYSFKLDISCAFGELDDDDWKLKERFYMKTERVVVGNSFDGSQLSTAAYLSNVKVRSILARKIKVLNTEDNQ